MTSRPAAPLCCLVRGCEAPEMCEELRHCTATAPQEPPGVDSKAATLKPEGCASSSTLKDASPDINTRYPEAATTPESETPLTEAIVARWEKIAAASPGSLSRDELESLMKQLASEFTASHYQLERAFSLAQTEIKGHMRIEVDLRIELERKKDDFFKAQARISELEKALAEHGTDAPGGIFS